MIEHSRNKHVTAEPKTDVSVGSSTRRSNGVRKLLVMLAVAVIFGVAYFKFGEHLSLEYLSGKAANFQGDKATNPVLVYAVAFLIYVAVTGLPLPGAAGSTLAYGWFFGFWRGVILVSFASTTGATLAFLLSRYLLRDTIQNKFGDRLSGFHRALEREGAFYLFTLRLIPAVPFFVINLVMGLTPIRVWTYWWVSQVGMLAGTLVYVYAGAQLPSLQELVNNGVGGVLTPEIMIALVLLGVFPIVVKKTMALIRSTDPWLSVREAVN